MTTIIFKNKSKAKVYKIYSSKDQGIYKKDEFLRTVKTDDVSKLTLNGPYSYTYAVEQP